MKWKYVFNTGLMLPGTSICEAFRIIKQIGYKFFTFNGTIYMMAEDHYYDTDLTTADLI
jgi:hypothetical protein